MMTRSLRIALHCLLVAAPVAAQQAPAGEPAPFDLDALTWRNVGPFRGGRVSAVAGIAAEPLTFYMGSAGGGIFKTTNAGITWRNVSDGFVKTGSVGALAVAPSDPNVVYAGMGEHTARANTVHHGDGVYKSTDAGRSWKHCGLARTQVISRIRVHPRNPDVAYVAAQGALYSPTEERGIYRTTDGGQTWKRVLFVGPTGGAADIAMDPGNPDVLYAAFWDHLRTPWDIRSYGPLSGIYKSTDGGETWRKLTSGLPATMGKVSVATTSDPNRVFALVAAREAGAAGLYRSDDGGATWSVANTTVGLVRRHWYYVELVTHPTNPDVVWVLNIQMYKSEDGGRTVRNANTPHSDRHDLWINPTDPRIMIIGDDGGAAVSQDGGQSWSSQSNQPTAQIYRVVTDNRFPYWVYGAQQDNQTIAIPNAATDRGGIERQLRAVAGYENSFIALDPDAPDLVYGTNILGEIEEQSQRTAVSRSSAPQPLIVWGNFRDKYQKYRFILNTPIFISRHAPKTLYVGANKLLASDDRGHTWREVSPDLTLRGADSSRHARLLGTAEIGDGAYGTIAYATESPLRKGILWTGSDDGLVGVTRDAGRTWHTTQMPGIGEARINTVDASPHDPAVAYVAATRFQFNDYAPYFFKTADYGRTWTRMGDDLPNGGWARVLREDPVRKGMLYAGTELGVFVSLDGGASWRSLQSNLPVTPIYDLVVHPRGDLVVATGGRAFWIFDDLSALRQVESRLHETALRLYRPRPAYRTNFGATGPLGGEPTFGRNPPSGAIIDFYLTRTGPVTIEIAGAAGTVVRRLVTSDDPDPSAEVIQVKAGLNRIVWNLRKTSIPTLTLAAGPGQGRVDGILAAPGTYTVKLTAGGTTATAPLEVRATPGVTASAVAYVEQERLLRLIERDLMSYRALARRAESVRSQLAEAGKKLTDSATIRALRTYTAKLELPSMIYGHLMYLHSAANSFVPDVRPSSREQYATLHADWESQRPVIERVLGADLDGLNAELTRAGHQAIRPVVPPERRQGRGGPPAQDPPG
jgi:photosystem II stability/assembly factor-like uncharacterized protein